MIAILIYKTNSFNVFPLKVALKRWVLDYCFNRQLLLNARNAHQAPLNGNTNPSHATANQPKQSGRWAGQNLRGLPPLSLHQLCLVAWYTLPIYIPPGNQRSRQNKQLKDQQNRIIAVRKCPGLVLAQDNSGHLQWLHSFCALDILHDTSTGSHKEMICAHNLDFVPWTQIYDLIPGSQKQ